MTTFVNWSKRIVVLILILLEVTQIIWVLTKKQIIIVLILILLEVTQIFHAAFYFFIFIFVLILILLEVTQIIIWIQCRWRAWRVLILILLEVTQIFWLSIIYFLLFVLYISHKVLLFNTIRYIPITFSQMYVLFLRKSIICLANICLFA